MLQTIKLKFSENPTSLDIPAEGVTIFVGPNNSGKSLILNELWQIINRNEKPGDLKIVDDIDINWPTDAEIDLLGNRSVNFRPDHVPEDHIFVGRFDDSGDFRGQSLARQHIKNSSRQKNNKYWILSQIGAASTLKLDGRTRFNLVNNQPMGDLTAPVPRNSFTNIFINDSLRKSIRDIIHSTIGLYFVIDPTEGGILKVRLSHSAPIKEEQSLSIAAREFHKRALYIRDASDGVQAYVGIILALHSNYYKSLLIDEPEAFLHPPLARKLGSILGSHASRVGGCMLASTHSSDFLVGCLQAARNTRIVRLEYSNGKSKARIVEPELLRKFYQSPLMRSANVLSALFYDGAVVCESDNDRAFYQEIYIRMNEQFGNLPSVLFINAQNKQTIKDIIGPLRKFGMAAAAITDIDILKDGGKTWSGWMEAAHLPRALWPALAVERDSVSKLFLDNKIDMKKMGVSCLLPDDRQACDHLFDRIGEYGVFCVRDGELESWLPELKVEGKKTEWVVSMLDKLGSDPSVESYVRPDNGGVWKFVRSICDWISNPSRRGTS